MNDELEQQYKTIISDLCTSLEIMRSIIAQKYVTEQESDRIKYVTKIINNCIGIYNNIL